jgi:decaprenyl-phosphate phosphoribosyltransferase
MENNSKNTVAKLIILMRPHQYIKNLFIFLPLFFGAQILDAELFVKAFIAFISFSMIASGIYILNDIMDLEDDRKHPDKRSRPLASGSVTKNIALTLMVVLFAAGFVLMGSFSSVGIGILSAYVFMNVLYVFLLKHVPIIDVTVIAIGFILRLVVGSVVTGVILSQWIVVVTFLLALFLALAKRRADVVLFLDTGDKVRRVVDGYTIRFLDAAMTIMASVVIVAYILYTTTSEVIQKHQTEHLYLTALFVVMGILRYLQVTIVENNSGSPTKVVFMDRFLQITIAAWVVSFSWIIYIKV